MKGLNIAFYTDSYLPAMDGVVASMLTFKKELEKRGHKVYIFASADRKSKQRYENERTFLYTGVKFRPYPQYNVALFPYNSIFKQRDLHIDIVHIQTPFVMGFTGLMSAKLTGCPVVGTFHTLVNNRPIVDAYYPRNKSLKILTKRYMLKYIKFFYNKCNVVISPSHSIEKLLKGYGVENVRMVPNAIDTGRFNPRVSGDGTRNGFGIGKGKRVVLYMGRLSKEKRLDVMIKAAKSLVEKRSDIRFLIGGRGPAERYYKEMVNRMGLGGYVKFIGFVEREMLPKVYAASDLLCMPSTFETQGLVSLEAMAMGKPVVGADYLATKELIVNGRNGEKFKAGDYTKCAQKIEKVLNNTKAYRANAIETAREFSAEKITDRLIDVYRSILPQNRRFTER